MSGRQTAVGGATVCHRYKNGDLTAVLGHDLGTFAQALLQQFVKSRAGAM